jgi:hypothetical protein
MDLSAAAPDTPGCRVNAKSHLRRDTPTAEPLTIRAYNADYQSGASSGRSRAKRRSGQDRLAGVVRVLAIKLTRLAALRRRWARCIVTS